MLSWNNSSLQLWLKWSLGCGVPPPALNGPGTLCCVCVHDVFSVVATQEFNIEIRKCWMWSNLQMKWKLNPNRLSAFHIFFFIPYRDMFKFIKHICLIFNKQFHYTEVLLYIHTKSISLCNSSRKQTSIIVECLIAHNCSCPIDKQVTALTKATLKL